MSFLLSSRVIAVVVLMSNALFILSAVTSIGAQGGMSLSLCDIHSRRHD